MLFLPLIYSGVTQISELYGNTPNQLEMSPSLLGTSDVEGTAGQSNEEDAALTQPVLTEEKMLF